MTLLQTTSRVQRLAPNWIRKIACCFQFPVRAVACNVLGGGCSISVPVVMEDNGVVYVVKKDNGIIFVVGKDNGILPARMDGLIAIDRSGVNRWL